MGLDIDLMVVRPVSVHSTHITYNLAEMAEQAGLYEVLFQPKSLGCKYAEDVIPFLKQGLQKLQSNPEFFKMFEPKNGWGKYEGLVFCVNSYLMACEENPRAKIRIS